ncbi:glycosyltransferase family 2 protein [Paractinoplanes hotanensis]|uniref:Glycosyltransferase n=1 Tax=Paractinoplanes hotanensis TaxID=2906497 RepID=A0ABT0Y5B7_9ACTN|nr:glycosyltransferase [Actinoplanes hotanensis]MCM4081234.1 glycosyltransferase [Actinoplanes hotanensis]
MWLKGFTSLRILSVCAVIAGLFLVVMAVATWYARGQISHPFLLIFWWVVNGVLIYHLYPLTRQRRRPSGIPATGRVVAIVGVHEQNEDELRACIWSILNQRGMVVAEVHVVDGGSVRMPVRPFSHPRIRWHRTGSGGKRAAQLYVLDRLEPADWDFVLAVDTACVLDEHAMERQLMEFSEPSVMATTAMVSMRNAGQNILTRLVDLSVGISVIGPASRSALHAMQLTPGALAVYRAHVLFGYKPRYPASSTTDDSCLAVYPHLRGEVVRVTEATVWSTAPADAGSVYRQSLRAERAWWRTTASALRKDPSRTAFDRMLLVVRLSFALVRSAGLVVVLAEATYSGTPRLTWLVLYGALYMTVRYARAGVYLAERPAMSRSQRLWTWILLTPVEAAYHLLCAGVIRYIALLPHHTRSGSTQEPGTGLPGTGSPAATSAVYYSGFASERTQP